MDVTETGRYANLSASALVYTGVAKLLGVFVASASSSPTIKIWDQTTAVAPILVNTFTPSAGVFYPFPSICGKGIYVTIGGTLDCTIFYSPQTA